MVKVNSNRPQCRLTVHSTKSTIPRSSRVCWLSSAAHLISTSLCTIVNLQTKKVSRKIKITSHLLSIPPKKVSSSRKSSQANLDSIFAALLYNLNNQTAVSLLPTKTKPRVMTVSNLMSLSALWASISSESHSNVWNFQMKKLAISEMLMAPQRFAEKPSFDSLII